MRQVFTFGSQFDLFPHDQHYQDYQRKNTSPPSDSSLNLPIIPSLSRSQNLLEIPVQCPFELGQQQSHVAVAYCLSPCSSEEQRKSVYEVHFF